MADELPHGEVVFPGVRLIQSCVLPLAHGISPSAGTLVIGPQDLPESLVGDLTLRYADKTVTYRDCKIDSASAARETTGVMVRVAFLDRRWKWKDRYGGGQITGQYNRRDARGNIVTYETTDGSGAAVTYGEKTPRELASLLLDALGETNYDVEALPEEPRPYVEWELSDPANELGSLADGLGCRVTLDDRDRVVIVKLGEGAEPPRSGIVAGGLAQSRALVTKPTKLVAWSAPAQFQVDLPLEAVGLELDGTIKAIDDLSYTPTGGWATVDIETFHAISDQKLRDLARACVFRMYRVAGISGEEKIAGQDVKDREQIVLLGDQVETITELGVERARPPELYGIWYNADDTGANTATELKPLRLTGNEDYDKAVLYTRGFSIDAARQLVITAGPVYRNASEAANGFSRAAAGLRLRTSVSIVDLEARSAVRVSATRGFGGENGTLSRHVLRSEVKPTYVPTYSDAALTADSTAYFTERSTTSNETDVEDELDYYLDALEREYDDAQQVTLRYAGLVPLSLSGLIHQITYTVGPQGTYTEAHVNNEDSTYQVPYRERRARERAAAR